MSRDEMIAGLRDGDIITAHESSPDLAALRALETEGLAVSELVGSEPGFREWHFSLATG